MINLILCYLNYFLLVENVDFFRYVIEQIQKENSNISFTTILIVIFSIVGFFRYIHPVIIEKMKDEKDVEKSSESQKSNGSKNKLKFSSYMTLLFAFFFVIFIISLINQRPNFETATNEPIKIEDFFIEGNLSNWEYDNVNQTFGFMSVGSDGVYFDYNNDIEGQLNGVLVLNDELYNGVLPENYKLSVDIKLFPENELDNIVGTGEAEATIFINSWFANKNAHIVSNKDRRDSLGTDIYNRRLTNDGYKESELVIRNFYETYGILKSGEVILDSSLSTKSFKLIVQIKGNYLSVFINDEHTALIADDVVIAVSERRERNDNDREYNRIGIGGRFVKFSNFKFEEIED